MRKNDLKVVQVLKKDKRGNQLNQGLYFSFYFFLMSFFFSSSSCNFMDNGKKDLPGKQNLNTQKGSNTMDKEHDSLQSNAYEVATLAAGCFWGVEELLRQLPGVLETNVGYTGGNIPNPLYGDVKTGLSGHAEAVQVIFDPQKISYEKILKYFFRLHDPTTLNRQGNDRGTQYRSAIFYHNDEQKIMAQKVRDEVEQSGKWKARIVTQLEPYQKFYKAEEYHQDYLQKNPNGYTCHFLREE